MGITNNDAKFLFYAKRKGVSFEKTLTLGRQKLYITPKIINELVKKNGIDDNLNLSKIDYNGYSESFFNLMGAQTIDSMDVSTYESATIIHDLNSELNATLHYKYSCVIDSGTLEHIFDFKTAIANCINLLELKGYFISISPINNLMGHGFYQFSPELFYSVFNAQNGFEPVDMLVGALNQNDCISSWYRVMNPALVGNRVVLSNSKPVYLFFIAKKIKNVEPFSIVPQQSDYLTTWKYNDAQSTISTAKQNLAKTIYKKTMPEKWRDKIYLIKKRLKEKRIADDDLGIIDARHFLKVDI